MNTFEDMHSKFALPSNVRYRTDRGAEFDVHDLGNAVAHLGSYGISRFQEYDGMQGADLTPYIADAAAVANVEVRLDELEDYEELQNSPGRVLLHKTGEAAIWLSRRRDAARLYGPFLYNQESEELAAYVSGSLLGPAAVVFGHGEENRIRSTVNRAHHIKPGAHSMAQLGGRMTLIPPQRALVE